MDLFKPDFKAYVPKLEENQKLVRIARGFEFEQKTIYFESNDKVFKI